MFDFVFEVPLWIACSTLVAFLSLLALGGMLLVRRRLLPRLRITAADAEFSGTMVQAVMVFYGLAVALTAITVWENYAEVSRIVSREATAIAALYRDLGGYPQPPRSRLEDELRGYVEYVIREAWPLQRAGKVPRGGVERMDGFQKVLFAFEPASEGQKVLHAEALSAYNRVMEARRLRLDSVTTGLPGVLWAVILAGAAISLSSSFFFRVDDARLHAIQVVLLAIFMALVIFVILALDRPFRGDLGIGPDSYELVYDQLMKR